MPLPNEDDPHSFREEAVRYRKRAAAVFDNMELRESYLALARSYERLADALVKRENGTPECAGS
jgi:hypothetical protein